MVDNKDTSTKEKILNALKGEFEVTKVEKNYFDNGVSIICEFMNLGKKGRFEYTLSGVECGVDSVHNEKGEGYEEEEDGEDIYMEIHDWIGDCIDWWTEVEWNGKKVK